MKEGVKGVGTWSINAHRNGIWQDVARLGVSWLEDVQNERGSGWGSLR